MMTLNFRSMSRAGWCGVVLLMLGMVFSQNGSAQTQPGTTGAVVRQQEETQGTLDPIKTKTDLYPANADAKQEIVDALTRAVSEKKRVLLVFGGNWCYDCHVLERALHEGAAGRVAQESYLIVHVDIGEGDKNLDLVKKYKVPLEKGVPAVVILNGGGDLLFSSVDGEFEAARRMMKKDLLMFLNRWKERAAR
jgi:thiol:disulfide interchange protein